jgi:membrane-associated protease RseP (regulator of RpoE activity)
MNRRFWHLSKSWLIGLAPLALLAAALPAQDVVIPGGPLELTIRRLPDIANNVLVASADPEEAAVEDATSDYWLGILVVPILEVTKQQLGIENGLAVDRVVENSPAAQAGIQRNDILTKVNDAPLIELSDLGKAVAASDGKAITITLLRNGKQQTVQATAAKRTREERVLTNPELAAKMRRVEALLKELRTEAGDKGLGLYFPRPGVVAPRAEANRFWQGLTEDKSAKNDFPKDLSVRIHKEGDQPARIHVKKGDQEWDVTEEKLGDLPDDIRPHVQRMLGKASPMNRVLRVTPDGKVEGELRLGPMIAAPPVPPMAPVPPRAPVEKSARAFSYRTERGALDENSKLDAILKKLDSVDRLEKELHELRKDMEDLRKSSKN